MIEGAQAGAAVHAPVGHRTISEGEVSRAAVQAGLRFVKRVVVKDAVCGLNSIYDSLMIHKVKKYKSGAIVPSP